MWGLILFFIPALWLGYLLGFLVRQGLGAVLYYGLADLTPFLIAQQNKIVWASIILALWGNLIVVLRLHYDFRIRLQWAYALTFLGGTLWLVACLIQPGWWLGPFGGLVMFPLMVALPLVATVSLFAMGRDELIVVFGMVLIWVGVAALMHAGVLWLFPS